MSCDSDLRVYAVYEEELADNRSIEVMMLLDLESLNNTIQYSTIQYSTIQSNTARYCYTIVSNSTYQDYRQWKLLQIHSPRRKSSIGFALCHSDGKQVSSNPRIQIRTSRWASKAFRSEERGRLLISGAHNFMQFIDRIRWFFDLSRWPSRKF